MNNEDTVVLEYFKNKKNGFYVDVGSYHPIHRNNTYLLHKQNWSGINIDISQFSIDTNKSNINRHSYENKNESFNINSHEVINPIIFLNTI